MIPKLLDRLEVLVRQLEKKWEYRANRQGQHHRYGELDAGKEIQRCYHGKGLILKTPKIVRKPSFAYAVEARNGRPVGTGRSAGVGLIAHI